MNKIVKLSIFVLLTSMLSHLSLAGQEKQVTDTDFRKNLAIYFPGLVPNSVRNTPVEGLYEVIVGARVYYFSKDARYLLDANIMDLKTGQNLTKPSLYAARKGSLDRVGEKNMLIFAPKKPKYTISVFTDLDCVYCRKLHSQMKQYNKLGIAIRYLFFPRAGIGSSSYKKAVSVWCSRDRKKAFTVAASGDVIPEKTCKNPVNQHLALVKQMALTGTPAIIFPDGRLIQSYISPRELLKILNKRTSRAAN